MMRFGVSGVLSGVLMAAGSSTALADPQSCLGSFSSTGNTGAKVSCVVPAGVSVVHLVAVGGMGGNFGFVADVAGFGAVVETDLPVTPGEILDV